MPDSPLPDLLAPALALPAGGRVWRIPQPSAHDGIAVRHMLLVNRGRLPEREARSAVVAILGADLLAEVEDTLPAAYVDRITRTALLHYCGNAGLAVEAWGDAIAEPEAVDVTDPLAPGYLTPDDPGGGPIAHAPVEHEHTGPGCYDAGCLRTWWASPAEAPTATGDVGLDLGWPDIFECWAEVCLDLHERYGVDVESGVLRDRTLAWLEDRIRDLATSPDSRLHRVITAPIRRRKATP